MPATGGPTPRGRRVPPRDDGTHAERSRLGSGSICFGKAGSVPPGERDESARLMDGGGLERRSRRVGSLPSERDGSATIVLEDLAYVLGSELNQHPVDDIGCATVVLNRLE